MSWGSGSSMFIDFWPLIQKHMPEQEDRIDFTAELLKLFVKEDMDPWEVEDLHEDVRAALQKSKIGIAEPDRYDDVSP